MLLLEQLGEIIAPSFMLFRGYFGTEMALIVEALLPFKRIRGFIVFI